MEKLDKRFGHLKIELKELNALTDNFNEADNIGKGGFGIVYKASRPIFNRNPRFSGHPTHRIPIAIKRGTNKSSAGRSVFMAEVNLLLNLKHTNIISLIGYCNEDNEMMVVYRYIPNKSYDAYTEANNTDSRFTWVQRLKICIGVARGLEYLHSGHERKIKTVHRDIKSGNILLDQNWQPIIGDFGLSVFAMKDQELSNLRVPVAGTEVYQDPHYSKPRNLSEKVDVYSFGVFLYELLSGKTAFRSNKVRTGWNQPSTFSIVSLLHELRSHSKQVLSNHDVLDGEVDYLYLLAFTRIADKCLERDPDKRPKVMDIIEELEELLINQITTSNLRVSFKEIAEATKNFDDLNIIGWGENARVYKGEFLTAHGTKKVAIKLLKGGVKNEEEVNFLIEILALHDYKHPNIIDLHGFHCNEKEKIVIYEYALNGSLDTYLCNTSNKCLTWKQILKICRGAARGLEFIHTFKPGDGIVHRDIKASNILLTGDWDAKISNFGLTKRIQKNRSKILISSGAGTLGYCDPAYMEAGLLTKESDVYSFGLVLFEVLGKKLVLENDRYYGEQVDDRKSRNNMKRVNRKEQTNSKSLSIFSDIAHQCVQQKPEDRPKMGLVVQELTKALLCAD